MKQSAPFPTATPEAATLTATTVKPRFADFVALTKPRVNALVAMTTFGGFYLGSSTGLDLVRMINAVAGTWLVAASAAALNQAIERDTDALMVRTRRRPLPDGRLQSGAAISFAILIGVAGLAELAASSNLLAAGVALATLIVYVAIYTPLKRYSSVSTLVGGIAGGLPPVIGWATARNSLAAEAWALFAIVFLWQMPHFLAIAWLCREDYARAGFPFLPVIETDGRSTGAQVVLYAAVLVPVSLLPSILGATGPVYFAAALLAGGAFLAVAVSFARSRTRAAARHLFLGSILYLPIVWLVMLVDKVG
ncbi:MAG: heme o synthase [Vicinamibacterales bacterium]